MVELTAAQIHRSEQGDALAGGRMQQDRIGLLRGHPHLTAASMLLKITFIQTPEIDALILCQVDQFF